MSQSPAVVGFAPGRILVQPRSGLSSADLDSTIRPHGGRRTRTLDKLNIHVIELPAQADARAVARQLSRHPNIKFAEPDYAYSLAFNPNDPYFPNAWHHGKVGTPSAWDTAGGDGVIVAILDTGIDASHPDLRQTLVTGYNTYDNNDNNADVHGHGTAVAGIAAAAGNNGLGVAGMNLRAKIMPIRVTDTSGYGYASTIANGITWAADRGARVANASFQGVAGSPTVQSAAQYMRNKGGVVVVAAGNSGTDLGYAPNSSLVVVSATDSSDVKASWSSFGSYVDIAAPGVSIWTTTMGGGYSAVSGTSAASPVTAGLYALMISANSNLQPNTLDTIVFNTATDLGTSGYDTQYGYGRINAAAAVTQARGTSATDTQPPTAAIQAPLGGTVSGTALPVDVSATDNAGVTRVELFVNNTRIATDTAAPYQFVWDTTTIQDGPATLVAKAFDAAGNVGTSATVNVTVANDTVAPVVTITSPQNGSTLSSPVTIAASATDNVRVAKMVLIGDGKELAVSYGSSLSYSYSGSSTAKAGKGGGKKGSTSTGTKSFTVQAFDPAGNVGTSSVTVTVQ